MKNPPPQKNKQKHTTKNRCAYKCLYKHVILEVWTLWRWESNRAIFISINFFLDCLDLFLTLF